MTNFTKIHLLVTLGLAIALVLSRSCAPKCTSTTVTKIIPGDVKYIKGESSIKEVAKYYPVDHEVPKYYPVKGDSIPYHLPITLTHEDSLNVVRAFYTARIYKDTIKGSQCLIAIRDSVNQNQILGRQTWIKNTRPQQVIQDNKAKVFAGFQIGTNIKLSNIVVAPELVFVSKKDAMYSLSYDIISQTPQIGLLWKIKIK